MEDVGYLVAEPDASSRSPIERPADQEGVFHRIGHNTLQGRGTCNAFQPPTQPPKDVPEIDHPRLKADLEARAYQIEALDIALTRPTLIVLPTGSGKSVVEWMLALEKIQSGSTRIVFLAPTNALVDQHTSDLRKISNLSEEEIKAITGDIRPDKRIDHYPGTRIIVATPQVIRNDLMDGRLDAKSIDALIFDEAHRARGRQAMGDVADLVRGVQSEITILAATASPGSTEEEIEEVCHRLGILQIYYRDANDPMLAGHLPNLTVRDLHVEVPEILEELSDPLKQWLESTLERIRALGFPRRPGALSIRIINSLRATIQRAIARGEGTAFAASKALADAGRIHHAIGILRSQGVAATRESLARGIEREEEGGKALQRFMRDPRIVRLLGRLSEMEEVHPKVDKVRELTLEKIRSGDSSRVIVFVNYRDTAAEVVRRLELVPGVIPERFVGQSSRGKDKGMSIKKQKLALDRFRNGESNVLVATSIGEEGLDIPSADRVIFYEPVGSEIRTIQRRGRTGRTRQGDVFVLIAEKTRDEGARYASQARERRMRKALATVHAKLVGIHGPARGNSGHLSMKVIDSEEGEIATYNFIDKIKSTTLALQPIGEKEDLHQIRRIPRSQTTLGEFKQDISLNGSNILDTEHEEENTSSSAAIIDNVEEERNLATPGRRNPVIIVDDREKTASVMVALKRDGVIIEVKRLPAGDYQIGDRVLIERKTARDFVASILDGRLLQQVEQLASAAPRPILIVEGRELFGNSSIHPNALLGVLSTIACDYGIPLIHTSSDDETARILAITARREDAMLTGLSEGARRRTRTSINRQKRDNHRDQKKGKKGFVPAAFAHFAVEESEGDLLADLIEESEAIEVAQQAAFDPQPSEPAKARPMGEGERRDRKIEIGMLSSLPGIGHDCAERLLDVFGNIPNILSAPDEVLLKVPGIGNISLEAIAQIRN